MFVSPRGPPTKKRGPGPRFKSCFGRLSALSAGLGFGRLYALAFGRRLIVGGLGGWHRRIVQWRASTQGRPQCGDLALQAGIVLTGGFQRALDNSPFHAFAL